MSVGMLTGWSQPAWALTTFCHGYTTYTDAHSSVVVHIKTCVSFWNNAANYNVRAETFGYLTNYSSGINTVQIGAKLEKPLGTVKSSAGCSFSPPVGSANAKSCQANLVGVSSYVNYYSTGRITLFYNDGFTSLGSKLCQTSNGPANTPSGWC
jgi:hypothetical protein